MSSFERDLGVAAGSPKITDITGLGRFAEALLAKEQTISKVHQNAVSLIDEDGIETSVNGFDAIVTRTSVPVLLAGEILHTRLGNQVHGDGSIGNLSLLFCTNEDLDHIETPNRAFSVLEFNRAAPTVHIIGGEGQNLDVSEPEQIEFVKDTVNKLTSKFAKTKKQNQLIEASDAAVAAEEARAAEENQRIAQNKRALKMRKIGRYSGLAAAILALSYIPQGLSQEKTSARVAGIPVPFSAESILDLIQPEREQEERALAYEEPVGALPLEVKSDLASIPLITDYDTRNVPDTEVYSWGQTGEFSKPGLFRYHFNFYGKEFKKTKACNTIEGDFRDGRTVVFAQLPSINRLVSVHINDIDEIKVCRKSKADKNSKGSIFLYQRP